MSALAALVTAAVPSLVSSSALAEQPNKDDAAQHDKEKPKAHKHHNKHSATAKKTSSHVKEDKKVDAPLLKVDSNDKEDKKADKTEKKSAPSKVNNAKKSSKKSSPKKGSKKTAKKSDSDAPRRRGSSSASTPCTAAPVGIDRGGVETLRMPLVDCKGKALDSARERLSVLARPWSAAKPASLPSREVERADEKSGTEIARGVKLLNPGLLSRLEAIAKKWPGKEVSVVSGYRPQSKGSMHQSARALDVRVLGVSNEELVAFCKTMTDTGCGYYPNSSFVHVDVRTPGTGSVSWIDASGPGETPRYVTQWPPPKSEASASHPARDQAASEEDDKDDLFDEDSGDKRKAL